MELEEVYKKIKNSLVSFDEFKHIVDTIIFQYLKRYKLVKLLYSETEDIAYIYFEDTDRNIIGFINIWDYDDFSVNINDKFQFISYDVNKLENIKKCIPEI